LFRCNTLDQLAQVALGEPATAGTPAGQVIAVDQQVGERRNPDRFHAICESLDWRNRRPCISAAIIEKSVKPAGVQQPM